jgi:predicted amidophosphoribosyltransferase
MADAGADVLRDADLLVPVPLHPWRAWRRGFNQAADLTAGLPGRRFAALRRIRFTDTQAGLGAVGRAGNVRGVFVAARRVRLAGWLARRRGGRLPVWLWRRLEDRWSIAGRIVVLVDDVRTTGATLEACAAILVAHGAREVRSITAALVEPR